MNYKEIVNYIEDRPWQGSSLDLNRMKTIMDKLNNPQDKLKCVHIAGTNGKGSCSAMLSSILIESGLNVGTYISPHLVKYNERISINNQSIDDKELSSIIKYIDSKIKDLDFKPRVFELLSAIAFVYFYRKKVDVVVLEVGLGGRLDATNVIKSSLLSIIMNIGLEHTEILGDSLDKIAYEKAGIIKDNCDVVIYDNKKIVKDVFIDVAKKRKANIISSDFKKIRINKIGLDKQIFSYKDYKNIELGLLGKHQFNNAAVVLEAVDVLKNKGYKITKKNVYDGLKNVNWPARLSILSTKPLFILDGAHNPQCAKALKESLKEYLGNKKVVFLCGVLKDKDYQNIIEYLLPLAKAFVCVTPNSSRALSSNELCEYIKSKNKDAIAANSVKEGIKEVLTKYYDDVVVACGSLYLAGDIIDKYDEIYKDYLRKEYVKIRNKISKASKDKYDKEIIRRIINSKEYKKAKNIMIYSPINNEVDLLPLTKSKNKVFSYPVCKGNKIIPYIPNNGDCFKKGKYGILEPIISKSKIMKKIDMIICPMVAFDDNLYRIGYGKGYYDRFLKDNKCLFVGVAYEKCKVNKVPINKHDIKLNIIYTNKKIYR